MIVSQQRRTGWPEIWDVISSWCPGSFWLSWSVVMESVESHWEMAASQWWSCCVRQLVLWVQRAAVDSSQPPLSVSVSVIYCMWMAALPACMSPCLVSVKVSRVSKSSGTRVVGAEGQTLKSQSHLAAPLLRFYQQFPTPRGDLSRNGNLCHLLQKLVCVSSDCQGRVLGEPCLQ